VRWPRPRLSLCPLPPLVRSGPVELAPATPLLGHLCSGLLA
jgi:hypothetical protein